MIPKNDEQRERGSPERTRAHELETLSQRDFSGRIPVAWVERGAPGGDYGIDRQVEIFEDGRPTGLEFYVQLKGTDVPLPDALAVSLPVKHRDHYPALALPVLMVRHHAPTGRTFAKWFHTYDPYYSSRKQTSDQKTFTFRWADSDEWTDETPARLRGEVEGFRRFRSRALDFPLLFHVEAATDAPVSVAESMLFMRELVKPIARVVALRADAAPPGTASVRFARDAVSASLGGVASVTLHREDDSTTPAALAGDGFAAIALALMHAGHPDAAARVLSSAGAAMPSLSGPEIAHAAFIAFSYAGRQREGVLLAGEIGRRGDDASEVAGMILAMAALGPGAPEEARVEYRALQQEREALHLERGQLDYAARDRYSIGNSFRASRRPSDAIRSYVRAARLDPQYRDLPYFNHELGGMLFIVGLYSLAAAFYVKAVALGARGGAETGGYGFTRALAADALLYAGRYADAEAAFTDAIVEGDVTPEWELKLQAIPLIRRAAGADVQLRRRAEAQDEVQRAITDGGSGEEGLLAGLRLDALNEDAWYYLGLLAAEAEPARAADFITIAALARLHDPNAWVWAFVLEWNAQRRDEQLLRIAAAGRRLADAAFRDELLEWINDAKQSADRDRLLELASAADELATDEEDSFVIRFRTDEGNEEVLFEFPEGR